MNTRKARWITAAVLGLGLFAIDAIAARPAEAQSRRYWGSWRDRDRDGIRNRDDRYPRVPHWRTWGGGDWDRDGIPNHDDRFKRIPRWRTKGWADYDRDGIRNRWDRDRDGDGVRNRRDRRPYRGGFSRRRR